MVYAVECVLCHLQYVGCTLRPLRTRISEHYHGALYSTDKGLSNVSKHFKHYHAGNRSSFMALKGLGVGHLGVMYTASY